MNACSHHYPIQILFIFTFFVKIFYSKNRVQALGYSFTWMSLSPTSKPALSAAPCLRILDTKMPLSPTVKGFLNSSWSIPPPIAQPSTKRPSMLSLITSMSYNCILSGCDWNVVFCTTLKSHGSWYIIVYGRDQRGFKSNDLGTSWTLPTGVCI